MSPMPGKRLGMIVGQACAASALVAGSLLAAAGAASAAPAGDPCPPGHKYTTTVGGVDGCNQPPTDKELNCYESGAIAGAGTAAGGGGPQGALGAAGAACANELRK